MERSKSAWLYTYGGQKKSVIEKDKMYTENANRSSGDGIITYDNIENSEKNQIEIERIWNVRETWITKEWILGNKNIDRKRLFKLVNFVATKCPMD